MSVFAFRWDDHRDAYARDGWVHVKDGIAPEFLAAAREEIAGRQASEPLATKGVSGQKDQYVLDFPSWVDYGRDLFDVIAPLTGLRRETMTLSERHVKAYAADADPFPTAHKDRLASQVSVGLSLEVPTGSHLLLYPEDDRSVNPFLGTGLRDSLEPDRMPEVVLKDARAVEIHDSPGDVVIFPGSSVWHLRRRSAGTVNIYLKFNDFDADPLGEDPSSALRRAATLAALAGPLELLEPLVPVLSRRFDSVVHECSRVGWRESASAAVWGQPPVPLSDEEVTLLRRIDARTTVATFTASADAAGRAVRRLAERGVVDLLPVGHDTVH